MLRSRVYRTNRVSVVVLRDDLARALRIEMSRSCHDRVRSCRVLGMKSGLGGFCAHCTVHALGCGGRWHRVACVGARSVLICCHHDRFILVLRAVYTACAASCSMDDLGADCDENGCDLSRSMDPTCTIGRMSAHYGRLMSQCLCDAAACQDLLYSVLGSRHAYVLPDIPDDSGRNDGRSCRHDVDSPSFA